MKKKAVATAAVVDGAVVEGASVVLVEPAVQAKLGGLTGFEAVELLVFVAAAVVQIILTLRVSPTTCSQHIIVT